MSSEEDKLESSPPPTAPEATASEHEEVEQNLWTVITKRNFIPFFMFFFPILFAVFIGIGWSHDDKVEESVNEIWTRQRSDYAKDLEYAQEVGRDSFAITSFAAMAYSRDGENLFTQERLEEIRTRMEETEATTIEYNGNTFTWDDVCSSNDAGRGTAYMFPCPRLTPMDYFQEARWFFQDVDRLVWYQGLVRKLLLAPRLPRFGILQTTCSNLTVATGNTYCDALIYQRMMEGQPLLLFSDIGNLENNDPCKMCIEEGYETTMDQIHAGALQVFQGLQYFASVTGQAELAAIYGNIVESMDRQAAIDFYTYYVTRSLYVELGASAYQASKDQVNVYLSGCMNEGSTATCPDPTTEEEAKADLANHADHTFSSTVTSGNPLPLWGDDGEGYLLLGTSPVGGSGIDMSGTIFSSAAFFTLESPTAEDFATYVQTDPVYTWFMASQTPMTAHCGNGYLKGTSGFGDAIDAATNALFMSATQKWCTNYSYPYGEDATVTVQHFARMWYDLLIDSPSFLNIVQGESDPYVWTTGAGCGYNLAGQRYSYSTSTSQEELMGNASGVLYYIDEGASVGPVDKNLLMGGRIPAGETSATNPLQSVSVIQTIYPTAIPEEIVKRVANCNRPQGSIEITLEDAEEILFQYKEKFEENWSRGWDDEADGNISFVGFYDDSGALGTMGRMLKEITLSNSDLIVISIMIIAAFSVIFVVSPDMVESRIMITLLGVALVLLAFFAAVGFGLMIGIKINITIAWTLPFIMLGLGVDDMYIVLLALREQPGYTLKDFSRAMKEVVVPISMARIVNAGMFAVMNVNDIPAIYLTARIALISVVFQFLSVVFCFSAWCYVDMQRQAEGRYDVVWCKKNEDVNKEQKPLWAHFFYEKFYKPLFLSGPAVVRGVAHFLVWAGAFVLFGFGIWGLTSDQRKAGLGVEEFFPKDNQASQWATIRTEELASWSIAMSWGEVDYTNPESQMRVIKQFEDVVGSTHVAEINTNQLWLADFLVWTTHQCTDNFDRLDPDFLECGHDQVYPVDNSTCMGTWAPNDFGLREKIFSDSETCAPYEGGICRPTSQMHLYDIMTIENITVADSWCPVVDDWDNDKLAFCLRQWRMITGGSGRLILEEEHGTATACSGEYLDDENVVVPVRYAESPTLFAIDLYSHEITIDMLEETRQYCDDDPYIHCWLTGIPYDYWSQYVDIYEVFLEIGVICVAGGFGVSFIFLLFTIMSEKRYSTGKVVTGSFIGALLISVTSTLCLVAVSGISSLVGVTFTGFSAMSFVLSVGYAVEYSVHVIARWMLADPALKSSLARVEYAMEFLFLPTFMSWVSSVIGVATLAFTEFEFNEVYFFRPLMIVMLVTYFFGCYWLPSLLCLLDFDAVKFGMESHLHLDLGGGAPMEESHPDQNSENDADEKADNSTDPKQESSSVQSA